LIETLHPFCSQKKRWIVSPPIFSAETHVVQSIMNFFFVLEIKKFISVDFQAQAFPVK